MQKEDKKTDYGAQSHEDLNDESVDDMLANVDQFIQGVYRDLSISPPPRSSLRNNSTFRRRGSIYEDSSVSSSNTLVKDTSLSNSSLANESAFMVSPTTSAPARSFFQNNSTFRSRGSIYEDSSVSSSKTSLVRNTSLADESASVVSPTTSRNMDAEIEQSHKDLNDESMDDMLANVDQFIQGVYRNLSVSPPPRTSFRNNSLFRKRRSIFEDLFVSSSNTSPVGDNSLADSSFVNESPSVVSPTTRRNIDAEIERNLTSTPSSSTTSTVVRNHTLLKIVGNFKLLVGIQRRRSSPIGSLSVHLIDLSKSQTPKVPRQPVQQNNLHLVDDEDVILVSANVHPAIDLCTPGGHQEAPKPSFLINQRQLNRRRLSPRDDNETCCQEGPSSTRKSRTEYFTPPKHSHKPSEPSNVDTLPAASDSTPFMCPVCIESCLQRQPTSTRCGHVFCKECIEQAIAVTHKCPLCNSKISRDHIFRIFL